MKRAVCTLGLIVLLISIVGCKGIEERKETNDKILGVWLSYSELDAMLTGGNFKKDFERAVGDSKNLGITDFFIHIRPFCDSYYPSKYFPLRESVGNIDFDPLEFMIDICHKNEIRVHGWINPYRVRTADVDLTALPEESVVRQWLSDEESNNDRNVCLFNGIYLNPAEPEAMRLITDGIREVLEKYSIDGIHFDDYFYPTQDAAFDKSSYELYTEKTKNPLSLDDWRRSNVNAFIGNVSRVLNSLEREVVFSISPAASIEKNYQSYYADIEGWIQNGYADWIMPQLYFGFNYPDKNFRFDILYKEWQELSKQGNSKLVIGLAAYKIGSQDEPSNEEWSSGNLLCREMKKAESADGFCFFSYSSLFKNEENNMLFCRCGNVSCRMCFPGNSGSKTTTDR